MASSISGASISHFDLIPDEAVKQIFSHFDKLQLLGIAAKVCRRWRILANMSPVVEAVLRNIPGITVFSKTDWRQQDFGLPRNAFENLPPFTSRELFPLIRRHKALPIEEEAGSTVLTFPRGLTPNLLKTLPGAPAMQVWTKLGWKYGDAPVDEPYHAVITDNVLVGSRCTNGQGRMKGGARRQLAQSLEVSVPKIIEAVTHFTVTFISPKPSPFVSTDTPRLSDGSIDWGSIKASATQCEGQIGCEGQLGSCNKISVGNYSPPTDSELQIGYGGLKVQYGPMCPDTCGVQGVSVVPRPPVD